MVLYVLKWNIRPESEGYEAWVQGVMSRSLSVGRVVELRGYRAASGSSQIVGTFEFATMSDWSAWYSHDDIQAILVELRTRATDVTTEIWGPTPLAPQPVRPGS